MSNFNFGSLANATGVASDKRLRAYSINKVKFVEAKLTQIHSEKNGTDYDVLNVRWETRVVTMRRISSSLELLVVM